MLICLWIMQCTKHLWLTTLIHTYIHASLLEHFFTLTVVNLLVCVYIYIFKLNYLDSKTMSFSYNNLFCCINGQTLKTYYMPTTLLGVFLSLINFKNLYHFKIWMLSMFKLSLYLECLLKLLIGVISSKLSKNC